MEEGGEEGGRQTDQERERDRQTDRDGDRERQRQRGRERASDRQTDTDRQTETERGFDRIRGLRCISMYYVTAMQPNAVPLGQTGSRDPKFLKSASTRKELSNRSDIPATEQT